ncbi:hypothetical protein D3C72_2545380 [compost metagenome]
MFAGRQAAIGIGMGSEDRHALPHVFQKAADRMHQRVRWAVFPGVDIPAVTIENGKMHMHAIAGL